MQPELAEAIVATFEGVSVVPLTGDLETWLPKLPLLDAVELSVMSADWVGKGPLKNRLKPGASVYCETAKFMIPLKKDEKASFAAKVHELAAENGLTPRLSKPPEGADTLAFDA